MLYDSFTTLETPRRLLSSYPSSIVAKAYLIALCVIYADAAVQARPHDGSMAAIASRVLAAH
jgi:hypothetical protein